MGNSLKDEIRFLTHAVVHKGKRAKVHYSMGGFTKQSGLSEDTITIYAKKYGSQLPPELKPSNFTDSQTDYFDTDTARVSPSSPYYKKVLNALKKAEAKDKMLLARRNAKYGWN